MFADGGRAAGDELRREHILLADVRSPEEARDEAREARDDVWLLERWLSIRGGDIGDL